MNFPKPKFIETDPTAVRRDLFQMYEIRTGKPLRDGQVESILLDIAAYREVILRNMIQEVGCQNLLPFATYPALDAIGAMFGMPRLGPSRARVVARISVTTPIFVSSEDLFVSDKGAFFRLDSRLYPRGHNCDRGENFIGLEAVEVGSAYNGQRIVNFEPPREQDSNFQYTFLTGKLSSGGRDEGETDEEYRARLMLAYSKPSAGTVEFYRQAAMAVHPNILDVVVRAGGAGEVEVVVLPEEIEWEVIYPHLELSLVNTENRPICDLVKVREAKRVGVRGSMRVFYNNTIVNPFEFEEGFREYMNNYAKSLGRRIGVRLIRADVIKHAMNYPGVVNVLGLSLTNLDGGQIGGGDVLIRENEVLNFVLDRNSFLFNDALGAPSQVFFETPYSE